jgi:ATP adenylyltransferase
LLLEQAKERILDRDSTVTGFNVRINDGKDAGQTIIHCHIHLIPRRKGDVADLRDGIRHVIPGRGFY